MYRTVLITWLSRARTTARAMRLPDVRMTTSWKARSWSAYVRWSSTSSSMRSTSAAARPRRRPGLTGGHVGHVRLEQPPGDDEVVEDVEPVLLGDGRREHQPVEQVPHRARVTVVPAPWRTWTSPFSCSIFTASRTTVRLTENVSQSAGSGGSGEPSGCCPRTIRATSSPATALARLAGLRVHAGGASTAGAAAWSEAVMVPPVGPAGPRARTW
jgi:hypothetical protein